MRDSIIRKLKEELIREKGEKYLDGLFIDFDKCKQ